MREPPDRRCKRRGGMLITAFVVCVQPADGSLSGLYTGSLRRPTSTLPSSGCVYRHIKEYISNGLDEDGRKNQGIEAAGESNQEAVRDPRALQVHISENIATRFFGKRSVHLRAA
ncbi:hypothetical protein FRC08_011552 [Ceratobasidium sp. 394]|nr:hypothetical protein FRC08_011552 [Ceratobasidium sp. 394]KAG9092160.1 hypothetical protein FS749_015954 [Ceratobasidium sp. UAMH 11750]